MRPSELHEAKEQAKTRVSRLAHTLDWPASLPRLETIVGHDTYVKFEFSAFAPADAQEVVGRILEANGYRFYPVDVLSGQPEEPYRMYRREDREAGVVDQLDVWLYANDDRTA